MAGCALLRLLLSTFFFLPIVAGDRLSAYDVLVQYGFPIGLLPKGVLSYELDRTTGKFSAHFNGTCSFSLQGSYDLRYRPTVAGRISNGKISGLKGISVKVFIFWLDIVEVDRVGDDLTFSVGVASTSFPAVSFEECPECGCGFDCGDGIGRSHLLSSSKDFV